MEKTESLNLDRDGNKLWKLAKALNDEKQKGHAPILENNQELLTGKKAANHFIDEYQKISDINIPTAKRKEVLEAQKAFHNHQKSADEIMTKNFTKAELKSALSTLKVEKSPGPDDITNEMLLHMGPVAEDKLLHLYNTSWKTGKVPQIWREAVMIPIHKPGKDKAKAQSYRPISLTSNVGKVMERLINNRLTWHLEDKQVLRPEQAGFRANRSTEDQVTYIAQEIEDAFQDKEVTLAVFVDMEKAFDKVWKAGLKLKLHQSGVEGNMYAWISQYLQNRKARVRVQGQQSRKKLLRQGVPQGGVLSPTLFLIFINDILAGMPKKVKGAIYADDLVLWCSEEKLDVARAWIQAALKTLQKWTSTWLVTVNPNKTAYTIFSLSTKRQKTHLTLNGIPLQQEQSPKYLGVTFDTRMTWKKHIENTTARAKRRLSLMMKLSGSQWGADATVLRKLYVGRIRPVMEYGITAMTNAAKSNTEKLSRVQNQAARIITGGMKSTPITAMETTAQLQPPQHRRDVKVMTQAEKFKRMTNHPMHQRVQKGARKRLKRNSFIKQSKALEQDHPDLKISIPKPLSQSRSKPTLDHRLSPDIKDSIPGILSKNLQTDEARRALTMEHIHMQYPNQKWTHVYTDGSATQATRDGGGGILIKYKDQEEAIAIATGRYSSNYRAEAAAIEEAARRLKQKRNKTRRKIVIFTDALSVLKALQDPKPEVNNLARSLKDLCRRRKKVVLQWIPAHCNIRGNEMADHLAKEGSKQDQSDLTLSYSEAKAVVKLAYRNKWKEEHTEHDEKDSYYKLTRREQVVMFRLRTGHNRLRHHLYTKFRIGESDTCPCGTEPMTVQHILGRCPKLAALRRETWPEGTRLQDQLYGDVQQLRKTTAFIIKSGLLI